MRLDNSTAMSLIDQRLAEIDALVGSEDFAGIERIVRSLPDLVASVPDADRRPVLLKIRNFLAVVHEQAESKSELIRDRLQSLNSGRAAKNAYSAAERLSTP